MVPLIPLIRVVVHAVDQEAHPTTPPGFRWAVMVGQSSPADLDWCANAGWCPTRHEAELEGEMVAVAAVKATRMFGVPCEYGGVTVLDTDPIPPGGDRIVERVG